MPTSKSLEQLKPTHSRRRWLLLAVFALALYALLPQLRVFHFNWDSLFDASWPDVLLAIGFTALTFPAAAASYVLLAYRPLPYGRTVAVELASTFASRLLPAGAGGIGVNFLYLRKARHTAAQAAATIAVNNSLGFVGHFTLLAMALMINRSALPTGHLFSHHFVWHGYYVLLIILLLVLVLGIGSVRHKLASGVRDFGAQIALYRRHSGRLLGAWLSLMVLTLGNVLSLYFCAKSLGVQLPLAAVLLVFTLGIGLCTAAPTPGGLGGMEAGLVAGFALYHVPSAEALASVLLYRLFSYWLTLAAGAAMFVAAQRRGYFG